MYPEKKKSGVALAITVASLFAIAPINASATSHSAAGDTKKCMGGNSCKGQSFCHTATSACAGQNSCKGQGWIKATKADCENNGGTLEGAQMMPREEDCSHDGKGKKAKKHHEGMDHKGKHGEKHGKKHGEKDGDKHAHRKQMEERLDRIEKLLQQLVDQNK